MVNSSRLKRSCNQEPEWIVLAHLNITPSVVDDYIGCVRRAVLGEHKYYERLKVRLLLGVLRKIPLSHWDSPVLESSCKTLTKLGVGRVKTEGFAQPETGEQIYTAFRKERAD